MPSVSAIIPNFNHGGYLEQRIESVLEQTYTDFEIIILDDCSTDNSRAVIEKYANHPKVAWVQYNETNSGSPFKQWFRGIELAKSPWIWLAESDDWCEPTFLENIMKGLADNVDAVVGYCQSYCIEENNKIRFQSASSHLRKYLPGTEFVKKHMLFGNAIYNASMAVWKKEAFAKVSPAFTGYTFCGDWLFWIELALQGDVFISGRLLNYFRKHEKDVSGRAYKTGLNFLEEVKMLNYLVDTKAITGKDYSETLYGKYCKFKDRKTTYSKEMADSIFKAFHQRKSDSRMLKVKHLRAIAAGIMHRLS